MHEVSTVAMPLIRMAAKIFCFVISPIVIMLPKIIVCFINVGIILSYNVDAKVSKIY